MNAKICLMNSNETLQVLTQQFQLILTHLNIPMKNFMVLKLIHQDSSSQLLKLDDLQIIRRRGNLLKVSIPS